MAECGRYLELMAECLGGELRQQDRETLQRHLSGCSPCREVLADYEGLLDGAREVEVPELPESYWDGYLPRLRERLERAESRRRARWEWLFARPAAAVASLAFILLAVFLARTPLETPTSAHVLHSMLVLTEPLDTHSDTSFLPVSEMLAEGLWAEEPWALLAPSGEDPFSFLDLPGSLHPDEWEALRRSFAAASGS